MHSYAIGVKIRCGDGQKDAFLLHSAEDIFGEQNLGHRFRLGFEYIGA
jgi:hypothetical protein